jgi:hypothetical protein
VENPGGLSASTIAQFGVTDGGTIAPADGGDAGNAGSGTLRFLYPYDGTIFPLGLAAPEIMWEESAASFAVRLHMKSSLFEYTGYFGPPAAPRVAIPQTAWTTAGAQSLGAADPLAVDLTVQTTSGVLGPIQLSVSFARGVLPGSLLYNTYTSPQASNNGAVMRLHLGDSSPEVLKTDTGVAPFGPCWSCHSVSANGSKMVADHHFYPSGPYSSSGFDLSQNPDPSPPAAFTLSSPELGFGAVTPDGSKVLTSGTPGDTSGGFVFPYAPGNVAGMFGPQTSVLIDAETGTTLPIFGWSVQYAKMPSFSPDGSLLAFNWHEDSSGHSLAVADFDASTNTVSNVRVVFTHATLYPGWPSITPDNREVVFALGDASDYVSSFPDRLPLAASELWTVDIATHAARPLTRANGTAATLPQPGRDEQLSFYPAQSPVAIGGYFWVFFMSRRTYGNRITQIPDDAPTKKIWVSAYAIRDGAPIQDPSFPPFMLPGQELSAGNHRPTHALDPCTGDGTACSTGMTCCSGQCLDQTCGTRPSGACAPVDNRCATSADCCTGANNGAHGEPLDCIAGWCASTAP